MISHPMTSLMRLLLALMVVLSGCQLESLSQRQSRHASSFWEQEPTQSNLCNGSDI